jgi:hypothetical protein
MVRLHRPIDIVGPGVFEREKIERFSFPAVDYLFGCECFFSFVLVEYEGAISDFECFVHRARGVRMILCVGLRVGRERFSKFHKLPDDHKLNLSNGGFWSNFQKNGKFTR